MAESRDVIIIGGGHNGLVTAFTWPKPASNLSYSSAALWPAALQLLKNFLRASAAPLSRIRLARYCLKS